MLLAALIVSLTPAHLSSVAQPTQSSPTGAPLLMRHPTLSKTKIAFAFAGDIWTVPRSGGAAVRLTSIPGCMNPCFSPDGTKIAFSGVYDGNIDVYVIPSEGGIPKRLTSHPDPDEAVGWTPDGNQVVYSSSMLSDTDLPRLFKISLNGGAPEALPFPSGSDASFSEDGKKVAYMPGIQWQDAWKRYRGGQTSAIWVGDLSDSHVRELPRKNSNDKNPIWIGDKIFFLSDREGPFTLYSYDSKTSSVNRLVENTGFDVKSAGALDDTIVYEQLGSINLLNVRSGDHHSVPIEVTADFPEVRTQFKNAASNIGSASISPTGTRAVFEARGDIFTVPASKGDTRNLTQTSDTAEREPSWSPDGQSICYFSDAGGEYRLVIRTASGEGEGKFYTLGNAPAYYYNPSWSPDGKKVGYRDNHHVIWYLDVASGKNTRVDERPFENPLDNDPISWSPDSKWIAYNRESDNHLNSIFLFSLDSGKSSAISDGMSDARFPIFDANGKYLYFAASTNLSAKMAWLDLSSYGSRNTLSSIYVVVLRKDLPSPLAPESDEEKGQPKTPDAKPSVDKFSVDLENIGQRVLALPIPARNYLELQAGSPGTFFAGALLPLAYVTSTPQTQLYKYNSVDKTTTPFLSNYSSISLDKAGDKILVQQGPMFAIVPTAAPPSPGQSPLNLSGLVTKVDPKAEWRQIYHEVWRIERDFFYDPNHHGQNLEALERKYKPFLDGIVSRDDLNYLFEDMLGELTIGHMFIRGGDIPGVKGVPGGLLGADYSIDQGHYRFAKIYNGENWNPGVFAPLTQPGVNVKEGEFLLAVNGKELTASDDIYLALETTAGKQVKLKVGPTVNGVGARDVSVVPVASEAALRHLAWVEDNRRKVGTLTCVPQLHGGRNFENSHLNLW
jgi:tricorn protease